MKVDYVLLYLISVVLLEIEHLGAFWARHVCISLAFFGCTQHSCVVIMILVIPFQFNAVIQGFFPVDDEFEAPFA